MLAVQAHSTVRLAAATFRAAFICSVRKYNTPTGPTEGKIWDSVDDAVKDIKSGDVLLCGGVFFRCLKVGPV